VDVGIAIFLTDNGPDPVAFAQAAEAYGFHSIFLPEHSHFPVARKTPYPDVYGGGDLPWYYKHTLDQIVTLSMIASQTSELKVGTGITLLAQHDPIWKAKELATLDLLSDGRLLCGLGYGWNVDEAEAHGVTWRSRFSVVRDKVAVMRALWTEEQAAYDGTHVSLAASWAWPKPQQVGGPPIYLGGAGPTTMREAADWADGWYVVPPKDDMRLEQVMPRFRQVVEERGRDPESISVAVAGAPRNPRLLEAYAEHGIQLTTLWVDPAHSHEQGMKNLEAAAKTLTDYLG